MSTLLHHKPKTMQKFYDIDKFGIVRIYKFKGVIFEAHWGEFINKEHLFTWLKSRSWVKPSTLNDIYFDIMKLTDNHLKLASNYYDKKRELVEE